MDTHTFTGATIISSAIVELTKDKHGWVYKCLSSWQYMKSGHKMLHIEGYYLDTHTSQF